MYSVWKCKYAQSLNSIIYMWNFLNKKVKKIMTSQIQEVKFWQIIYTNKYKLHIFTLTMMGSCPIDTFIVLTIFFSIMNVRVIMKGAL